MSLSESKALISNHLTLREPSQVMDLKRMGAAFPTRLSFMRILLRHLIKEKVEVKRRVWDIDSCGIGHAIYSVELFNQIYSLIAFSILITPEERTDRVIAEKWDTTYVLFDGAPKFSDIERLRLNVPLQEAGRFEASELILSRANKSVRLFDYVVECLSNGHQPDDQIVSQIGYLMRTTAVYGNGKFGIADHGKIVDEHGLKEPFQAELLTIWLIRGFTHDLVEHIAYYRNPKFFVTLDLRLKKYLGIGNATGLGMAPFLVTHPILIHNWALIKELALGRLRGIKKIDAEISKLIIKLITRAEKHLNQWDVNDLRQSSRINVLRREIVVVKNLITSNWLNFDYPWERLIKTSSCWSIECQELIIALILEPYGALIDDLADCMSTNAACNLDPAMTIGDLKNLLVTNYDWALLIDFNNPKSSELFWYVSEEKLEPRLGSRLNQAGVEKEMPIDVARQIQDLARTLKFVSKKQLVAEFLLKFPEQRQIVKRVQGLKNFSFSEIRTNLISSECMPIDMLRWKLAFFGACKFDPKSDRWTRVTLYQGAPIASEVQAGSRDDWWLPVLESLK